MPKKAEQPLVQIELDGEKYELAEDSLTLGELAELETYLGESIGTVDFGSARTMLFLIYLVKRRRYPDTTLADVSDIKPSDVKDASKKEKRSSPKPTTPEPSGDQS